MTSKMTRMFSVCGRDHSRGCPPPNASDSSFLSGLKTGAGSGLVQFSGGERPRGQLRTSRSLQTPQWFLCFPLSWDLSSRVFRGWCEACGSGADRGGGERSGLGAERGPRGAGREAGGGAVLRAETVVVLFLDLGQRLDGDSHQIHLLQVRRGAGELL